MTVQRAATIDIKFANHNHDVILNINTFEVKSKFKVTEENREIKRHHA